MHLHVYFVFVLCYAQQHVQFLVGTRDRLLYLWLVRALFAFIACLFDVCFVCLLCVYFVLQQIARLVGRAGQAPSASCVAGALFVVNLCFLFVLIGCSFRDFCVCILCFSKMHDFLAWRCLCGRVSLHLLPWQAAEPGTDLGVGSPNQSLPVYLAFKHRLVRGSPRRICSTACRSQNGELDLQPFFARNSLQG